MKKNRFKRINKGLCCELLLREGLQSKKRVTKLVLAIITVFTGYDDGGGDYDHDDADDDDADDDDDDDADDDDDDDVDAADDDDDGHDADDDALRMMNDAC